jgi:signal transduction histidine kinase
MVKFLFILFLVTIFSCEKGRTHSNDLKENLITIKKSLDSLKSVSGDTCSREKEINKTYQLIQDIKNDSLKNEAFFYFPFLENKDSLNFIKLNNVTRLLSQKLRDTAKIAESYWDLAYFFSNNGLLEKSFFNYSKAQRLYASKGMKLESGRMLLRMAIIQKNIKDYTGSEINTINAIRIFEPLKEKKFLYGCYNNLGIIYNELQEYDRALFYHKKANEYLKELKTDLYYKEKTLNNIGVVYQNTGEHSDAISHFREALLNKTISEDDPYLYAMLLDNFAYSKMLAKDTLGVYKYFLKGLRIREKIQHKAGIAINKIHLAEYFALKGDSVQSNKLAQEAYIISEESGNNKEVLQSLFLLSKLNRDRGKEYLDKFIALNDSLQKEERAIRNKFARIRFETDEFIAQNYELNIQKRWMIFGFSGLTLLLVSVFLNRTQRIKNRELKLIQRQQQTNEEIYDLLIESQTKIEEAQEKEKKRISRELHDGILSQFFGVRLNLEFLNDSTDEESITKRSTYINELKLLEKEIRKVSHELNIDFLSSERSFLHIVTELLKEQENYGSFKSQLIVEDEIKWENLAPKLKINLFRIIQEALHNVTKYADAENFKVSFLQSEKELIVIIEDDGRGFEIESIKDGIGIKNMRMRCKDLKGVISFKSGDNGTRIEIIIPKRTL